jgi:hypothetical protein
MGEGRLAQAGRSAQQQVIERLAALSAVCGDRQAPTVALLADELGEPRGRGGVSCSSSSLEPSGRRCVRPPQPRR